MWPILLDMVNVINKGDSSNFGETEVQDDDIGQQHCGDQDTTNGTFYPFHSCFFGLYFILSLVIF